MIPNVKKIRFCLSQIGSSTTFTPCSLNRTPLSATCSSQNRKRKRLKDRFSSFSSDLSPGQLAQKRRSSASDVTRLDVTRISEGSFLDFTTSPDIVDGKVSTSYFTSVVLKITWCYF